MRTSHGGLERLSRPVGVRLHHGVGNLTKAITVDAHNDIRGSASLLNLNVLSWSIVDHLNIPTVFGPVSC